uniref:Spermatogenesis and centriole associated 1 n=1 Tax=Suricata suricatta TaxID=37032 RepID=A0A673VTK9_SURSU
MSLLTNYEGLRHQIERLVRENEELKKLVRLIRENHELKSAIKTQAGGLGISGFSTGLGEAAATPSQYQGNGVYLPPSPAAASEPVLEEVGIMALANMLNSSEPGPTAGPLSALLPPPGPMPQSNPFTSILTSPWGNALPSTGPLTPGSTLMAPVTGTVAVSLSSPLPTSTAAPLGVSQNLLANPMSNLVLSEAPRAQLTEPFGGCPSGLHPSAGAGPAVSDPRGPRGIETPRKSIVDLERKLAHRKSNKFSDGPGESRQLAWERLVGEIAFQLDRRILSSIFPERVRLYGFTVSNIPEKIIQASLKPSDHKLDEELCQTLTQRYVSIMNRLQGLGYNGRVHPALTEQLVNAYGILRERPELASAEGGSYSVDFLQRVLVETVHPSMLTDALLLLSCLNQLAHDDGRPMFIW